VNGWFGAVRLLTHRQKPGFIGGYFTNHCQKAISICNCVMVSRKTALFQIVKVFLFKKLEQFSS